MEDNDISLVEVPLVSVEDGKRTLGIQVTIFIEKINEIRENPSLESMEEADIAKLVDFSQNISVVKMILKAMYHGAVEEDVRVRMLINESLEEFRTFIRKLERFEKAFSNKKDLAEEIVKEENEFRKNLIDLLEKFDLN